MNEQLVKTIEEILSRGNDAEIREHKHEIVVQEVQRKKRLSIPLEQKPTDKEDN